MTVMQMLQSKMQVKTEFSSKQNVNAMNDQSSFEKFGSVFSQVMNQQENLEATQSKTNIADEIANSLNVETVDELFALLNIDAEVPTPEDPFTSENLAELLNIDTAQLEEVIENLLQSPVDMSDIWTLLQDAPQLVEALTKMVSENDGALGEDEQQLIYFLKLTQLIGQQKDTIYQQEFTLTELKQSLEGFVTQLNQLVSSQAKPQTSVPVIEKYSMSTVQQIIQQNQTEQKVAATNTSTQTNNESLFQQHAQANNGTRIVTVNLPANPASQAEALAKEIQNLLNRSQMSNNQGTMKLMLKLFPENLGQIRIEIFQQNGVMTARLLASTSAGKELLDSNLNQLKASFVAQNIQMDRIDVTQALNDLEKDSRDQSFFNNFFKQQSEEAEDDTPTEEEEEQKSFEEYLNEEVQ